jgi:hypothetical protein
VELFECIGKGRCDVRSRFAVQPLPWISRAPPTPSTQRSVTSLIEAAVSSVMTLSALRSGRRHAPRHPGHPRRGPAQFIDGEAERDAASAILPRGLLLRACERSSADGIGSPTVAVHAVSPA